MKKQLLILLQVLFVGLLASCEGQAPDSGNDGNEPLQGKITLLADKTLIRADGSDQATLQVLLTDSSGMILDVTDKAEIYMGDSSEPLTTTLFTASSAGTFSFYALYGMEISNDLEVKAVSGVADLPTDSDKASTNFNHKLLLVQHTGSACPNCPGVMNNLKRLAEDSAYADKYLHVASHSYNEDDNAYSSAASILASFVEPVAYPWVTFNLLKSTKYLGDVESMKDCIDLFHEESARVGICASASEADGYFYANVGVKAAQAGNYRVGVWVLEDNIYCTQSGATASWQHIHSNALREMAGNNKTDRVYGGTSLRLDGGASGSVIVEVAVDEQWVASNCKLLIFVTTDDGNGNLELVNSTLCPIGESVAYAYN